MKTMNLKKLINLIILILLYPCIVNAAGPFMLVSEQEYQAQLGHQSNAPPKRGIKSRSMFGAVKTGNPVIVINSPTLTTGLRAPIQIDIAFKAYEGAKINAESLKVLYGWLNLDITDRIKEHATVSLSGLSANNIDLPRGEHTITIEITDSKDRTTEKEVTFDVL